MNRKGRVKTDNKGWGSTKTIFSKHACTDNMQLHFIVSGNSCVFKTYY